MEKSNIRYFPEQPGECIFVLTHGIARRIHFLVEVLDQQDLDGKKRKQGHTPIGYKYVRRRTIERCMRGLDDRGNRLATLISHMRSQGVLSWAIRTYSRILVSKGLLTPECQDAYCGYLIGAPVSLSEIDIIIELLHGQGISYHDSVETITGHIPRQISVISENDIYQFMRSLSKKNII